jgi:hypothetical protein
METQALKDRIDAEPANAGRTDAEVLVWLKESVDVYSDVPWSSFALWAARYNGVIKMETHKASGTTDDIKRAAATGLLVLTAGQPLSLSVAEVRALMGNLVPDVFSVPEKEDLLAFSESTVERFSSYGFPEMDDASWLYHINYARSL